MAKKVVTKRELEDDQIVGDEFQPLTDSALSIIKTGEKLYSVVKIGFNPETGYTGEVEIVCKDLDIYEAQYQFKMLTVELGIF